VGCAAEGVRSSRWTGDHGRGRDASAAVCERGEVLPTVAQTTRLRPNGKQTGPWRSHGRRDDARASWRAGDDGCDASDWEAHESHGHVTAGNSGDVQRTREWRKASRLRRRTTGNSEGAAACGDVGHGYDARGMLWRVWHRRGSSNAWERVSGNPVNLMVGCRMQQACGRSGGGNRQGGERPRRRNERVDWRRHAEAARLRGAGVDTRQYVDGGAVFEEP
jgi:hypothetical protein